MNDGAKFYETMFGLVLLHLLYIGFTGNDCNRGNIFSSISKIWHA